MFHFYLNDEEIQVETGANFRGTQDTSLDDGSLVLEWLLTEETIKPRSTLKITNDNNSDDVWNFIVLSDNVEPVDKNNKLFKHTLVVSEKIYELSHRKLRNSKFQQPTTFRKAKTFVQGYLKVKYNGSIYTSDGEMVLAYNQPYRTDKVYLDSREKVNSASIEIDTWCKPFTYCQIGTATSGASLNMTDGRNWIRNAHTQFPLVLEYREQENSVNPDATEIIYIKTGTRQEATEINEIASSFFQIHGVGYYNLALDFDYDRLPTFQLTSSEMMYGRTTEVEDADFVPNILVYIDISFRLNTYYYSIYDVLDQIKTQSEKWFNGTQKETTPYTILNQSTLEKIVAPDYDLVGLNVHQALCKVFEYIDAVPKLNENNELDFEYINDFNGNSVAETDFVDKKTRITDQYYDNQIITQYSNAKQPSTISYPGKKIFKHFEATHAGIVGEHDYTIATDQPIESIDKLFIRPFATNYKFNVTFTTSFYMHYDGSNRYITKVYFGNFELPESAIDISSKVYEYTVYKSLGVGSYTSTSDNQNNTLYFVRGSKQIPVDTYTETGYTRSVIAVIVSKVIQETWNYNANIELVEYQAGSYLPYHEQTYTIEYFANLHGQTMVESMENKKAGQITVAQTSGSTDINKMGTNMLGLIARMGNEEKSVCMQLTTYDSRLKKGSIWVDSNGVKWIANIVKITFTTTNQVITDVEFVKNFNALSQRTEVDEEIKFYDIESNTITAYENVNEYLYFSTSPLSLGYYNDLITSLMKGTFLDSTQPQPNCCVLRVATDGTNDVFVPFHIYGAGNTIEFEIGYDDPMKAGSYLVDSSGTIKQRNKLYTTNGFATYIRPRFYKSNNDTNLIPTYPIATNLMNDNDLMFNFEYRYLKRLNENLHFAYGLALLPKPIYDANNKYIKSEEIFFGEEFISQNHLIMNNKYKNGARTLYLYVSNDEVYGINDKKALGNAITETGLTVNMNTTDMWISFTAGSHQQGQTGKSWCIADENGNIYIAVNQNIEANNSGSFTTTLYYGGFHTRI